MKAAGEHLDKSVCTEYIIALFDTAKDMAQHCQYHTGPGFWGLVSRSVTWARLISPGDLYDLSIRVISARRVFLEHISYWAEMKREENWPVPDSYFVRIFNEANTAVDGFTKAVYDTYGANSKIRERFYPKWTDDSDNEGTAEATRARFLERCAEPRTSSTGATVEGQSTVQEGEDKEEEEKEYEGVDEGEYEGGDEYEEADGDVDSEMHEMDYEMNEEMDEEMGGVSEEVGEASQEMQPMQTSEGEPGHTMTLPLRFH
ncbi:uncharacterized protein F4812DRAFT_467953 [Daldinia caldariorum]|uniref:uncharacterized protein n=1 Tax=Daldinia caldariorum TaxID=326644 RepID=UPI00200757EE|nr:uncharacterized protein F4812DRAFT_467953 [Daldinia caldariorum]KAI1464307.1 hypothetical protein F4812DRAFT_467953 [Daldinia caldariorum]